MQGQHTHGKAPATWSTGFCGCFSDCSNCCITLWCPCVTFGRIAEIVDHGATSCGASAALCALSAIFGCGYLYSCLYRGKMRAQHNLKGHTCADCLAHYFCGLCALTQEYRELKNRGFDMIIGWHTNVDRQNRGVATEAPVVEGGMKRQIMEGPLDYACLRFIIM